MVTRVSEQSWFGRIGGAFKGILIGGLLVAVSVPLLFWNEGRAVKTAKGLKEGAKVVVEIDSDAIDPSMDEKFVHATGATATDDVLRDKTFNVAYNGIRLVRHVEMFQWDEDEDRDTEKKLGGGTKTVTTYSYEKGWHSRIIDSNRFEQPAGHQNPNQALFPEMSKQADNVRLGKFRLPASLISMINGQETVPLTDANIPVDVASRAAIRNDGPEGATRIYVAAGEAAPRNDLVTPTNDETPGNSTPSMATSTTGSPSIGDVRVWFTATPVQTVSLLSQQKGESFQPFETEYGTTINVLKEGTISAAEMIAAEEAANKVLTWLLRGAGALVMFIGFTMLLRPLVVVADVIPIAGSLVGFGTAIVAGLLTIAGSMIVIGIAWIFYRPLLGISLLLVAALALFLIFRRGRSRRRSQPETLTEMDLA